MLRIVIYSLRGHLDFLKKKTHQTDTADILSTMVYEPIIFLTLAVARCETRTGMMIVLVTGPSRTDRTFSYVNKLVFCLFFLPFFLRANCVR